MLSSLPLRLISSSIIGHHNRWTIMEAPIRLIPTLSKNFHTQAPDQSQVEKCRRSTPEFVPIHALKLSHYSLLNHCRLMGNGNWSSGAKATPDVCIRYYVPRKRQTNEQSLCKQSQCLFSIKLPTGILFHSWDVIMWVRELRSHQTV